MIGSFLTRGLVTVFGYAYPAYECYKTVEKNKPDVEQLRFWCQYWILVAVLSVCERIGDAFISWVPMYSEAKLAFFVYLWYPKTRGTTYVYDSFFRPYIAKHENEIDRNLLELRTRAGDMAVLYWERAASYGQTRIFDILQYVASQSTTTPRPRPAQPQGPRARQKSSASQKSSAPNGQAATKTEPETEEPPSPSSSTSSSQHQEDVAEEAAEEVGPSKVPTPPNPEPVVPNSPNKNANDASQRTETSASSESTSVPSTTLAEAMQIEPVPPTKSESSNLPPKETVMEETIRRTGGRLRKTRSAVTH